MADVTDRDVELVADADYHAAFGRAVEFGDGERSDLRRLRELPGLLEHGGPSAQQDQPDERADQNPQRHGQGDPRRAARGLPRRLWPCRRVW